MRLEKELGALNSEILSIKEKWKIALNIDKKKIAIERLISMRRVRDSEKINSDIESAVKSEERKLENIVIQDVERFEALEREKALELSTPDPVENSTIDEPVVTKKSTISSDEVGTTPTSSPAVEVHKRVEEPILERAVPEVKSLDRSTPKKEKRVINESRPPHMTIDWLKRRMTDKV